jgi:hypothetical protein
MNVYDFLSECWDQNPGPFEFLCSDCCLMRLDFGTLDVG